jgi:hypothetical protein
MTGNNRSPNARLWFLGAVVVLAVVALVLNFRAMVRCEQAGWTFLWREGTCIEVRTLRP